MENKVVFYLHSAAAFQYLHAAIEYKTFELIESGTQIDFDALKKGTDLSDDSLKCLLFGLVSLNLVSCENGIYKNSNDVKYFFDCSLFGLIKSMSEFQSKIVYLGISEFAASLKDSRNKGLKYIKGSGQTLYQKFAQNKKIKKVFYRYMEDYSEYAINLLLKHTNFDRDKKIIDVGGGMGINAITIAKNFPESKITIADLNFIENEVAKKVKKHKVQKQISFSTIDIFQDNLPVEQDCVLFIHQLVIWSFEENVDLLTKANKCLNQNGRVIIYSSVANDTYSAPLMAALDSVYFKSVATGKGLIYSYADYERMLKAAGFSKIEKINCNSWTPHGIVIGNK